MWCMCMTVYEVTVGVGHITGGLDSCPGRHRAAAFDVTGRKTTETSSVIFRFSHKTAWQESSNFYSDLRNANRSELTKYYCVNYHCSAVTMPIRSSSYATSSTSELLVSVQLPLNSMFFCHAEVLSHVVLLRQCSRSIDILHKVV